jgi:two-component system response regulator AtoC
MFPPSPNSPAMMLVVDDELAMQRYMRTLLEVEGHRVETANSGSYALEKLNQELKPDFVFLDLLMPGLDGLETLEQMRRLDSTLKVIMLSCVQDSRKVAQAIRLGALDYLTKPFSKQDLDEVMEPSLGPSPKNSPCGRAIDDLGDGAFLVGLTPTMHKLRAKAELVAKVDIPVLLLGESGTGKEVFARLIHKASPRIHRPFLKINCAAVPAELLESELFGYEAGAFTGATHTKPGKFELCNKGTILLDEIGEMPPALQAKLLHFLQDQRFSRLGGRSIIQTDVRVLAATNIDIHRAIATRKLRQDLYYRLNGITFHLPPLRERRDDIPFLLSHFLRLLSERYACAALALPQFVIDTCTSYRWPGNVRELENFVKRCLVLREFDTAISDLDSSSTIRSPLPSHAGGRRTPPEGLKTVARSAREEVEAGAILDALEATNWNRKQAAVKLKISYKALLYKIREYQIDSVPVSAV